MRGRSIFPGKRICRFCSRYVFYGRNKVWQWRSRRLFNFGFFLLFLYLGRFQYAGDFYGNIEKHVFRRGGCLFALLCFDFFFEDFFAQFLAGFPPACMRTDSLFLFFGNFFSMRFRAFNFGLNGGRFLAGGFRRRLAGNRFSKS